MRGDPAHFSREVGFFDAASMRSPDLTCSAGLVPDEFVDTVLFEIAVGALSVRLSLTHDQWISGNLGRKRLNLQHRGRELLVFQSHSNSGASAVGPPCVLFPGACH